MFFLFTLRVQHQSSVIIDRNFIKFSGESQNHTASEPELKIAGVADSFSRLDLKRIAARTVSSYYFGNAPAPERVNPGPFHQVRFHIAWLSKR